jgi:hypothetical protein
MPKQKRYVHLIHQYTHTSLSETSTYKMSLFPITKCYFYLINDKKMSLLLFNSISSSEFYFVYLNSAELYRLLIKPWKVCYFIAQEYNFNSNYLLPVEVKNPGTATKCIARSLVQTVLCLPNYEQIPQIIFPRKV